MEMGRPLQIRVNWLSILLHAALWLAISGSSLANPLNARQGDGELASEGAENAHTRSIVPVVTGASTINAPVDPAEATPTGASNETAAATSASAAADATSTGSPLNSTNDPHECHVTAKDNPEGILNPFCFPVDGQQVQADHELEVTWDTAIFQKNSTNTIQVYYVNVTGEDENILAFQNNTNLKGYVYMNMSRTWLDNNPSVKLTLEMISLEDGTESDLKILHGPVFELVASNATNTTSSQSSSSSSSGSKRLGEKVGLPIGLVVLIAILIALGIFICMRRRGGQGYPTRQSRSQRTMENQAGVAARHKRQVSFHDEPTRGMELQDRNKGLTGEDNWDWGSPVTSPVSAGRQSNAFRDEINRQRSGR